MKQRLCVALDERVVEWLRNKATKTDRSLSYTLNKCMIKMIIKKEKTNN